MSRTWSGVTSRTGGGLKWHSFVRLQSRMLRLMHSVFCTSKYDTNQQSAS